ncbi:MAG: hypothetical protein QW412_03060 [Candidatus Aenigmatarchaeota archaeon]
MKLYFASMHREREFTEEVFKPIFSYISKDETLDKVFNSFEVLYPIKIPTLKDLEKSRILKRIFEEPYGDRLTRTYTLRYIEETVKKLEWHKLEGRILILTDVKLSSYTPFDFETFKKISGAVVSNNTVVISSFELEYDLFMIYKEAKHEVAHTFGLGNCKNDCIMNHTIDFKKRSLRYCLDCNKTLLSKILNS